MPDMEAGYSEEALDKQANKLMNQNQVIAVNIFDPKQIKKKEDEENK